MATDQIEQAATAYDNEHGHSPGDCHVLEAFDAGARWALREHRDATRLLEAARWAFETWFENDSAVAFSDEGVIEEIPDHDCWYFSRPDAGVCPFHDEFFDHYLAVYPDALDPRVTEDN